MGKLFMDKSIIAQWQSRACVDISTTQQVENIAEALSGKGVKAMDSLHVASAIAANAAYFLTTDKALLRKMAGHNQIRVVDPIDFVRILTGDFDEN
jgi:predicted nucleic acid-binding protein